MRRLQRLGLGWGALGWAAATGLVLGLAAASCSDDVSETTDPDPTCAEPPCDDPCPNPPCDDPCADPPCDDPCPDPPCDDPCPNPPCDEPVTLTFEHVAITIDDPIVNGTSLMVPIDGISYAHAGGVFITAFGRDFDDPSETFLWHLDEASGSHQKRLLTGQVFADGTSLCAGEEWCQLIGLDPSGGWVIVGPAAPQLMRVSAGFAGSLSAVSGPQPSSSYINHSHRFTATELFLYGATGPSGFSSTVHALTLATATWRAAVAGLPQIDENCLAYDESAGVLYSVGGRTTTDGGDTTETVGQLLRIDVGAGTFTSADLPSGIGPRQSMSCAFDAQRGLLYAFGGAVVVDRYNDALNTFHNDLWVYAPETDTWTEVIADSVGGTLSDPDTYGDQRFVGDPMGPNFGKNRGLMQIDEAGDRILLIGAVPVFTHEQLYKLALAGVETLL